MPVFLKPEDEKYDVIPLDRAVLFFGRHPDCDVIITCSRRVSRKHCCIAQIDDYFVVRDLGSMNGITVAGERIKREVKLSLNDKFYVGDVGFKIVVGEWNTPRGKRWIGPAVTAQAEKPEKPEKPDAIQPPPKPGVNKRAKDALRHVDEAIEVSESDLL